MSKKKKTRRVQVHYLMNGTMCVDVNYTTAPVNTTLFDHGHAITKLGDTLTLYAHPQRIRITTTKKRGKDKDLA